MVLARSLAAQDRVELSSRAYASAFAAEPTNAQILWDHAQLLQQHGRHQQSHELLRRLATSDWQPRFNALKQQAQPALHP